MSVIILQKIQQKDVPSNLTGKIILYVDMDGTVRVRNNGSGEETILGNVYSKILISPTDKKLDYLSNKVDNSIIVNNFNKIELVGDIEVPGVLKYYGTNSLGERGFFDLNSYLGGLSGYSGISGFSGYSGISGFSGYSGVSGFSGYSGRTGISGYSGGSGYSGRSGMSGYSGKDGVASFSGHSGFSGYSGLIGHSGFSGVDGFSGYSGYSGKNGVTGLRGISGFSGYSGSGRSGFSGYSGAGESGFSGYSGIEGSAGESGFSGYSGVGESGFSGYSGLDGIASFSGHSGFSGYSGAGESGFSGYSGVDGSEGQSGFSGYSGVNGSEGQSGFSGYSGAGESGFSGYSGVDGSEGQSGFSGYSGVNGSEGESGFSGYSGVDGSEGQSGFSGYSGVDGSEGESGFSGYSGVDGSEGQSGFSGYSGVNGSEGQSGFSGYSGAGESGFSGYSGVDGSEGESGFSGYSGVDGSEGQSGFSGYSGVDGSEGQSGFSGYSGVDGSEGESGFSGYSGVDGSEGQSGFSGYSGVNGSEGQSGFSGYNGVGESGFSGYSGVDGSEGQSGFSGYSGVNGSEGESGFSGYSGVDGSEGQSGFSGYSGVDGSEGESGFSGYSGVDGSEGQSGFSGYSGVDGSEGESGFSGYSGEVSTIATQFENGVTQEEVLDGQKLYRGFVDRSESELSLMYDAIEECYSVRLTRTSENGVRLFRNGKEFTILTGATTYTESVCPDDGDGLYFVTIQDETDVLVIDKNPFVFSTYVLPVALLLINRNATLKAQIADERHSIMFNTRVHEYLHKNYGARFLGNGLSDYNVGSYSDAVTRMTILASTLWDEDIELTLPQADTTDTKVIFFQDADGEWDWIENTEGFGFTYDLDGVAKYNEIGVGLTDVPNLNYYNTYICMTNFYGDARFGHFLGNFVTNSSTTISARTLAEDIDLGSNFAFPEVIFTHKITWQIQNSQTNKGKCRIINVEDIALNYVDASSPTVLAHNLLSGRDTFPAHKQIALDYKDKYSSTDIPALQIGQRINYIVDAFNNTYEYEVIQATTELETPYTHPAKFLRISPHRSQFELKSLYRFFVATSGAAPTYSSITYTYDGVNYITTAAFSATVGSILIYNYDTGLQVQAIALNNAKYLHYNVDNNKLYVTTNSNTIVCYSPTGTLVGSYNIDNTVTLTGMSNIERVGALQIAVYAWDGVTPNTFVYHVTLNADGTFATTIKQTINTGNNTAYSRCKYVASNNRLYCATANFAVGGARNKGYYMNLDISGGAFVNTIVTVSLTDWESGAPFQMYSDIENVGNYLYLNCNYGVIRTDFDLANEKAILLDSTTNRFVDDVECGRIKYVPCLNKLLVARYPKYTNIRGHMPMLVYQLDLTEIEGFGTSINAARNVYISEFQAPTGNINYDVKLVGVDEINNHIIVATKDVHIIKFYKY